MARLLVSGKVWGESKILCGFPTAGESKVGEGNIPNPHVVQGSTACDGLFLPQTCVSHDKSCAENKYKLGRDLFNKYSLNIYCMTITELEHKNWQDIFPPTGNLSLLGVPLIR